MAVYKVIQDIEAEDKLLGPLGIRQFIYALAALTLAFINFKLAVAVELGSVRFLIIFILALPMLLLGVLAAPLGDNQSTEVWLIARIRFFFKPQKRVWDQNGLKQLVYITAPKRVQRQYTDGLSQTEVRSRLRALATTLDSRGWAVKNVNVNLYSQPGYLNTALTETSDRLVTTNELPQDVPAIDIRPEDDILDASSNIEAQHVNALMKKKQAEFADKLRREMDAARGQAEADVTDALKQGTQPQNSDQWFKAGSARRQNNNPMEPEIIGSTAPVKKISREEEAKLTKDLQRSKLARKPSNIYNHLRTINPTTPPVDADQKGTVETAKNGSQNSQPPKTEAQQTAILGMAQDHDLNSTISVATLSHEAKRKVQQASDGEVVINLHGN